LAFIKEIFGRKKLMNSVNDFKNNGYAKIKNVIPENMRDFVTQYALFDEMQDFTPDGVQVPSAHSKYADPAMETMLLILHENVEKHTGLVLYPTYSFFRVYRPEDELEIHTDRPSCEISATLCFNYSYNKDYHWPIYMNDNEIVLEPGDMAIYKGCDIPHYRKQFLPPSDTDWHVQGFFHYVDKNGPNSDWKFDKRETIGESVSNVKKQTNKSYIEYL